jgi:hypothetical protein
MKRVQIVTVSTDPQHKNQKLQKKTAKKWGYQYVSIGQGVEWKGFVTKMEQPIQYLKTQIALFKQNKDHDNEGATTLNDPNDTLYVFVDAYDLVFTGPPDELLVKYAAFDAPIVVGAERVCFGNCQPSTCTKMNNVVTARQYINTGCVMGSLKDLMSYYEWGRVNYPADDQVAMSKFRNINCGAVVLDSTALIALNYETAHFWFQHDNLELLEGGRFRVKQTGATPCIIHCPFIFQDLGHRWNYVLKHALPGYIPTKTKTQHFHLLIQHVTKQIRSNKTYFVLTLVACYFTLLFMIALICAGVFGVRTGKSWMERYENAV